MNTVIKVYGFGVVAESPSEPSDYLKVTPVETLPLQSGRLIEQTTTTKIVAKDAQGASQTSEITNVNFVVAKWLPLGQTNRQSAPNKYEGQSVLLISMGNSRQLHWVDAFREPALQGLEDVTYLFSNEAVPGVPATLETSIVLNINTRDQRIRLTTPKNRGEIVAYDILLDLLNGLLKASDSNGNFLQLDSQNNVLSGEILEEISLKSRRIRLEATESLLLKSPERTDESSTHVIQASSVKFKQG